MIKLMKKTKAKKLTENREVKKTERSLGSTHKVGMNSWKECTLMLCSEQIRFGLTGVSDMSTNIHNK